MQLPSPRTPIARCEQISLYTQRMLQKFPNEAGLAGLDTMLATSTQTLMATQSAYRDSVTALIVVRVDVKFADYVADKGVRQGQRFAQLADGGSKGRFSSHLYPDGTTPIVRLVGESQVTEMKKLEGRYTSLVGTWSDAATEGAKIAAFCLQYEGALFARKDAMQTSANRRAARDVAKEDFLEDSGSCVD